MPAPESSFDYAVVRIVPRVDREEFLNAGIVLFCATQQRLLSQVHLDESRLRAFCGPQAQLDVGLIRAHLEVIPRIAEGQPGSGSIGELRVKERFHWLVAPRSTVVQCSPVHSGLCESQPDALERVLERLMNQLVRMPTPVR